MVTTTDADLVVLERLIRALSPEQLARLAALPGMREKLKEIAAEEASP